MGLYVVMGVSGCGKSSVGEELAKVTGGSFLDADDFHPPANKAKMAAGIPLQDEDRWGWLDTLNAELRRRSATEKPIFLACSALRQVYRDRLASGVPRLRFIYLKGSREVIGSHLEQRTDHFMPTSLLESQFAILEEPTDALTISVEQPFDQVVAEILSSINPPASRGAAEAWGAKTSAD